MQYTFNLMDLNTTFVLLQGEGAGGRLDPEDSRMLCHLCSISFKGMTSAVLFMVSWL